MEKDKKSHITAINSKYQVQHRMKNKLHGGSYSVSDIQDYFEYILKKHGEEKVNPSIRIYTNETENRITFKIKTGYYLELLTPEPMKVIGSTKSKITKDENGKNVPYLGITEVVLIRCNVVNDSYQQKSRVLYTFVPNKSFSQFLNISPENFIFLKPFDLEIKMVADQNSNTLEIEDKINIHLVIN